MPLNDHYPMSDEDLGALLAYIQSLPQVDNQLPEMKIGSLLRVAYVLGQADSLVSAEIIDHTAPRPPAPERGVTVGYGKYMAGLCSTCHGPGFSGGPIPGAEPEHPPAFNLTPAGELQGWNFADFLTAMRTGVTPSDRQLRDDYMPYKTIFGDMMDDAGCSCNPCRPGVMVIADTMAHARSSKGSAPPAILRTAGPNFDY